MNVKEFRMGNLLQYQGEEVTVVGFNLENNTDDHLVQIQRGKEKINVSFSLLKPVLLTSAWMSKLGFKESYRSESRIRYDVPGIGKYDFDLSSQKLLEGFLYCGNYIHCQYLHQLQNIYFVLKGEELQMHSTEKLVSEKVLV